jgi:uncharacterized protein YyaL (SSP411 family)
MTMSETTNRLANETSPYLLQHRHNPVDWHPWGPEAFAAARTSDRPIFLSVGYSTCYWCHVMERESFESPATAAVMNQLFVCIKVDREERPDVDQLYMTAVQVLTRQGGWPMSVFLTPDLRPFYGGTYFPPTDHGSRPGFVSLLREISDAYKNRRDQVEHSANQVSDILRQASVPDRPRQTITLDKPFIERLVARSESDYDPASGGFGSAPKFPRQSLLELLLVYNRINPDDKRMARLRHTLDSMANGGIRDQLGGGFHRYSTDADWLVPHFEIMLYDNATLAWCYIEAYRQTEDRRYAAVARGIFDFVLREMTSPDGAFYTAFDAEVDAREGLTYLWTRWPRRWGTRRTPRPASTSFAGCTGWTTGPTLPTRTTATDCRIRTFCFWPTPWATTCRRCSIRTWPGCASCCWQRDRCGNNHCWTRRSSPAGTR